MSAKRWPRIGWDKRPPTRGLSTSYPIEVGYHIQIVLLPAKGGFRNKSQTDA
jgi:hypothetical protein